MSEAELRAKLIGIVQGTPWLMGALQAAAAVDAPDGYVAAGAIRDTVWARLTGRSCAGPHGDVDLVYFDASEAQSEEDYERALRARAPGLRWEVTNQATVHRWHARQGRRDVAPHRDVAQGLMGWPETATAVGVRLGADGRLEVLAPLGLRDLFALELRHNGRLQDARVFRRRVRDKRWLERFPELTLIDAR